MSYLIRLVSWLGWQRVAFISPGLVMVFVTPVFADQIRYVDVNYILSTRNNSYFSQLLALALTKTEQQYGEFELDVATGSITQHRQFIELNKGTVDVFWTMTTTAREQRAIPVKVPLLKGVYGMRLLAIHREDAADIAGLNHLPGLSAYTALLGQDWPDTEIMRAAGLPVTTHVEEKYIYRFLEQNPGFYFPRAITEIFAETDLHPDSDIVIDSRHLIVYPAAMYFFVARSNHRLKERLTKGLNMAIADGSLDKLFNEFPGHRKWLKQAALKQRKIHWIDNPLITDLTQKERISAMQRQIISGSP